MLVTNNESLFLLETLLTCGFSFFAHSKNYCCAGILIYFLCFSLCAISLNFWHDFYLLILLPFELIIVLVLVNLCSWYYICNFFYVYPPSQISLYHMAQTTIHSTTLILVVCVNGWILNRFKFSSLTPKNPDFPAIAWIPIQLHC